MAHLYFTRHGQTIWNVENKICGATDIELTALGHQQAKELGRKLLEEGLVIDEILYSPWYGRRRRHAISQRSQEFQGGWRSALRNRILGNMNPQQGMGKNLPG